ncbi:hypothetical protein [Cedecea lapagei]|uniref:hypothetical protein n=1 Tax=Cedecea lapagei TaxID=158823 RepID=UPI001BCF83D8|nr:hypothetical protein [Cedecea lapagei]
MKKNYIIPGFEPDEIHDMAKSALKQIHERRVDIIVHGDDESNSGVAYAQFVNLHEQYEVDYLSHQTNSNSIYTATSGSDYNSFHQHNLVTDAYRLDYVDVKIHEFDRQLDSADHGKNLVVGATLSAKKVSQ